MLSQLLTRFLQDEGGATAIEYGLIASLIVVVILSALTAFGNAFTDMFNGASAKLAAAMS